MEATTETTVSTGSLAVGGITVTAARYRKDREGCRGHNTAHLRYPRHIACLPW